MARAKQLNIFPEKIRRQYALTSASKSFGGSDLVGKRKVARPLATNRPIHLVLKSSEARGKLSFLNHRSVLDQALRRISRKWGIQIQDRVWVSNHIHMTIQLSNRTQYRNWIRELAGAIVLVLGRRLGQPLKDFFDHRPFTRIIEWGRDFISTQSYLQINEMQNFGLRKWSNEAKKGRNERIEFGLTTNQRSLQDFDSRLIPKLGSVDSSPNIDGDGVRAKS